MTITLIIVIITALLSFSAFSNQKLIDDLIFYPPAIQRNQYYRFITHGFIHADLPHLIFNMIALYSFGNVLEKQVFAYHCYFGAKGSLFFFILYFGGLIAASIPDYFKYKDSYHFRSLGASGAVSAVIFSSIVLIPTMGIGIMFLPVNIPGYIFAVLYIAISAYLDKRGGGYINHKAHISGAIFGLVFTIIMVAVFSKVNVFDNFMEQIKASEPFLPFCGE